MISWEFVVLGVSLLFGTWGGLRYRGSVMEKLLIGTGCLVWWPVVLLHDFVEYLLVLRQDRALRAQRRRLVE
jgi:hypothetical protein